VTACSILLPSNAKCFEVDERLEMKLQETMPAHGISVPSKSFPDALTVTDL
jgi:hypothetical protein